MSDKAELEDVMATKKSSGRVKKKTTGRVTPSFQESAKKFKPGPVAPPEREQDRPNMSGGAGSEQRLDHELLAVSMLLPAAGEADAAMSEGMAGVLKPMPGEEGGESGGTSG